MVVAAPTAGGDTHERNDLRRSRINCPRRIGVGRCRFQLKAPVMMVAHLTQSSACFGRSRLMTVAVTTRPGDSARSSDSRIGAVSLFCFREIPNTAILKALL